MSRTVILQLSALAVLITYLCVSACLRHREAWRQRREDLASERAFRKHWQPTALDSSSISQQVEQLRRDYLAAVHSRPRQAGYRSRLIGSVRDAILRLSYFRNLRRERPALSMHETQKCTASLLLRRTAA